MDKREKQRKSAPSPYSFYADAMKSGVGKNSGSPTGAQLLGFLPVLPLPQLRFRHLTSGVVSLPTSVEERKSSTTCPHLRRKVAAAKWSMVRWRQ